MPIALGFFISVFIALTGVGAGSLTTPLLILLLGMPAKECVGTALIFGAVVKIISVPTYMKRGQVNRRALLFMLGAGLPGVLLGALLLRGLSTQLIEAIIGFTIVTMALLNLFRFGRVTRHDRTPWLAAVGLPIGIEMGFSSAGAGAIGALALMSLTTMGPAEVVGTGLSFGLGLSVVGGGINAALGSVNLPVLWKLIMGGIPGAIAGSALAGRLPSQKLRFALCVGLVVIGAQLSWKSLSDYRAASVAAATSSGAATDSSQGQSVKK